MRGCYDTFTYCQVRVGKWKLSWTASGMPYGQHGCTTNLTSLENGLSSKCLELIILCSQYDLFYSKCLFQLSMLYNYSKKYKDVPIVSTWKLGKNGQVSLRIWRKTEISISLLGNCEERVRFPQNIPHKEYGEISQFFAMRLCKNYAFP